MYVPKVQKTKYNFFVKSKYFFASVWHHLSFVSELSYIYAKKADIIKGKHDRTYFNIFSGNTFYLTEMKSL